MMLQKEEDQTDQSDYLCHKSNDSQITYWNIYEWQQTNFP